MELKEKVYKELVVEKLFNYDLKTTIAKLSKKLQVGSKKVIEALNSLKAEQRISIYKTHIANGTLLKSGKFRAGKGNYGFIELPDEKEEVFVKDKGSALNGDLIQVGFVYNNGKKEAFMVKIVERSDKCILGRVLKTTEGTLVFVPDDKKIGKYISIIQDDKAKQAFGKKCSLKLSPQNNPYEAIDFGTIDNVFGSAGDPIVENVAIAYQYGFTKDFDEKVKKEVTKIPSKVEEKDFAGRVDLRDKNFVTIDPENCKDMDDAVYIEKVGDNYRVYVAIADVSHYVKLDGEIDKEAYSRGTSCYLGDGVYPMLPEELSNGICSLNEKEDRCALCTIIDIDKNGNVLNYDIQKAIINSKHKLSYEDAQKIHENTDGKQFEYADIKDKIDLMYEASDILVDMRNRRGCIVFDNREPSFKLDETKTKVIEVQDKHDITSKKIIESFMVLANEVVGDFFTTKKVDTLYRVHDKPLESRLERMAEKLSSIGIYFDGELNARTLQELLHKAERTPCKDFANSVILRSMAKAKYQPKNIGHYGLASEKYIHFTSPIRRYPDLIAHRMISDMLEHKNPYLSYDELVKAGSHLTAQEKAAEEAEIQSDKLLCTIWAEEHINEVFEGYIYSIDHSSITVRVGLVNITVPSTELIDSKYGYMVNNLKTSLTNIRTGFTYNIGEKVKIKLSNADRNNKTIYGSTNLTREFKFKEKEESIIKQDVLSNLTF